MNLEDLFLEKVILKINLIDTELKITVTDVYIIILLESLILNSDIQRNVFKQIV